MEVNTIDYKDVQCFDETAFILMNKKPTSSTDSQYNQENWTNGRGCTSPTNMDVAVKLENTDVQDKLPERVEDGIEYFYCPHCEHTSHLQTDMEGHVELFHKENNDSNWPRVMSRDNQGGPLNLCLNPIQTHVKPVQCPLCEFRASQEKELNRHIESKHLDKKLFLCPHCDYRTNRNTNLKKHVEAMHLKMKPFTCPQCHYKAGQKSYLKKHIEVTHLKFKPFCCHLCDFTANEKNKLKKHIEVVHLKMKPFLCPHCEHRSSEKANLKKHIESLHLKMKPFTCPQCEYKASQKICLKKPY